MDKKIHKVIVDRDLCIGAATCVIVAPKVFEIDAENKAIVLTGGELADDNLLLLAAQSCPTQAIFLYDKSGKQLFPQPKN